jgi:hypothetical protein
MDIADKPCAAVAAQEVRGIEGRRSFVEHDDIRAMEQDSRERQD